MNNLENSIRHFFYAGLHVWSPCPRKKSACCRRPRQAPLGRLPFLGYLRLSCLVIPPRLGRPPLLSVMLSASSFWVKLGFFVLRRMPTSTTMTSSSRWSPHGPAAAASRAGMSDRRTTNARVHGADGPALRRRPCSSP